MTLDRALAAAKADLGEIPPAALWCFHNGYRPLAPNPNLPSGMNAVTGPMDYIPGPRWDIGQGDYRCRTAWQAARTNLLHADQATHTICDTLRSNGQPARSRIDMHNPQQDDIASLTRALTWRIEFINRFWPQLPWDLRSWVKDALTGPDSAVALIADARSHLISHHHRPGDLRSAPTIPMCNICTLKPAEPRRGGKCARCEQRLYRAAHDGTPKAHAIAALREETAAELAETKARRAAHGCGYGAA